MKIIASLAAVAAASTLFIPKADARPGMGCYPYLAAQHMHEIVQGGGTWKLAVDAAYDEGYIDLSESCKHRVLYVFNRYGHVM